MEETAASLAAIEAFGVKATYGEPVVTETSSSSPLLVSQSGTLRRTGTVTMTCGGGPNAVHVVYEVSDDIGYGASQWWTLELDVWMEGPVLHLGGTIEYRDVWSSPVTDRGGWIYDPATGLQEDPASDPFFHDEVRNMLALPTAEGSTAQAAQFGLGSVVSMIGNILSMLINYLIDIVTPPPPPSDSCSGPSVEAGCDVPCSGNFAAMCAKIDELPDVSDAFKRCMKGRCGCGGSAHRRVRITCDDADSCGPCGGLPSCDTPAGCGGCNLSGSEIWYCRGSEVTPCSCINTVFHEMSHACGALDLRNGSRDDAYRIGDWFG
ncbi:MAG: hypothetical protein D6788_01015, partial [Planctomycetota bacterium]